MRKKPYNSDAAVTDRRYGEQQTFINETAARLGVVVYRPNYHSSKGDPNTVLLYTREDHAHNCEVEKEPTHYLSREDAKMYGCTDEKYFFRPALWCFQNTDTNGLFTYDFANRGKLKLRDSNWKQIVEGSIETAYYRKMQMLYVRAAGGYLNIREADTDYNDYNRRIIDGFTKACGGTAVMGSINPRMPGDPIFWTHRLGGQISNFACGFILPDENQHVRELIEAWRGDEQLPKRTVQADEITQSIENAGGESFIWY